MNRILATFRNKNAAIFACMAGFLLVVAVITLQIPNASPIATEDRQTVSRDPLLSLRETLRNSASDSQVSVSEAPPSVTVLPPPVRSERSKVVEAKYENLSADLVELDDIFKDCRDDYQSTQSSLQALMTDESGSRVGQSVKLIESFESLHESVETLGDSIKDLDRSLQLCHLELEENLEQNPDKDPPVAIAKSIASIRDSLRSIDEESDSRRLGLAFIVKEAQAFSASDKKLSEAIELRKSEREIALLQTNSEQEQIEDEKRLAAAKELQQQKADAVLAIEKQKAEDAVAKLLVDNDLAGIVAKAERDRTMLEAEFERDLPNIKHYLGTLFVKSNKQPGGGVNRETKESMPVSLTALKSHGFSNPDVQIACQSLLVFFSYFKAGDRGQGPYPSYYAGGQLQEGEMAAIRPAYDLLDKYCELLVEKGLLAP